MKSNTDNKQTQSSRSQKVKKIIKYFLMTFLSLAVISIIVFAVLYYIVISALWTSDQEEIASRDTLANKAMDQIVFYRKENGHYPKNLRKLPIYGNKEFIKYIEKHTFGYYSTGANYSFSWNSGPMGWTGYCCSNFKSKPKEYEESNIIRTYPGPDGAICTVKDLH